MKCGDRGDRFILSSWGDRAPKNIFLPDLTIVMALVFSLLFWPIKVNPVIFAIFQVPLMDLLGGDAIV